MGCSFFSSFNVNSGILSRKSLAKLTESTGTALLPLSRGGYSEAMKVDKSQSLDIEFTNDRTHAHLSLRQHCRRFSSSAKSEMFLIVAKSRSEFENLFGVCRKFRGKIFLVSVPPAAGHRFIRQNNRIAVLPENNIFSGIFRLFCETGAWSH
jgi:hypothetical protein